MSKTLRNVAAIAGKELRSYFGSPVAWVMMGLFAFIFGWFFTVYLRMFMMNSMQSQFGGAQPVNVNMSLIRPLLGNASVLVLFLLPMITMRTYSEEKRSGTIELLLTSPLTDLEIILGKFVGAIGLYAAMLLVTVPYVVILFFAGNPEWRPLISGYLGLFLLGSCFVAVGLFISSPRRIRWSRAPRASSSFCSSGSSTGPTRPDACRISRSRSTSTTSARASSTPST